jgi:outer membrane protein OmpA-like peptidoglycan-associated protein
MAFVLLSRSGSKPQGSVKPVSKRKSARGQHSVDSLFGFAKPVVQPRATALPTAPVIQAKLKIGEPNDEFEQEADRVADVMTRKSAPRGTDDAEMAQYDHHAPKRASPASISQPASPGHDVPPIVYEVLRLPGQPLDPAIRAFMEPRFGHDFSQMRVHTDAKAAEAARVVDAQAYTVGQDVVFSEGYYTPHSHQGSKLLAHELVHVIQQERGGALPPPLRSGWLEQAADAAVSASAFAAGRPSINVAGASAPGLARQPLVSPTPTVKPRSLTGSLLKDEKNLDDAALELEIKLIQQWLEVNPSSPENDHLRSELKLLEDEELERMEKREAEGRGPKEGTAAKLISIVHKGRLEVQRGLSPGYDHCFLTKGTMEWRLGPSEPAEGKGKKRRMQIKFTPKPSFANKTITFLQTWQEITEGSAPSEMARIDIEQKGAFRPFYGMNWDPKMKKWIPAGVAPEEARKGYKNQPSSATDPAAYLYDEPWFFPTHGRIFESVAVVPETGETLGGLTWGVGDVPERAKRVECSDKTSTYFQLAVEKFYAPMRPTPRLGEENYDVILDGFIANDATLTADQERQLDPIVARVKGDTGLKVVVVGGFGDAMDRDPMGTSERRAQAVANYLTGKGVPEAILELRTYGATWARYEPSTKESKEGRNRRVQLRLFY